MKFCLFSHFQLFGPQKLKSTSKEGFFQYFDQFSRKSVMGCFLLFSPKDGHSKMTKKNWTPCTAQKNIFFENFKYSSDRKDLNLYFDKKKITVR